MREEDVAWVDFRERGSGELVRRPDADHVEAVLLAEHRLEAVVASVRRRQNDGGEVIHGRASQVQRFPA